MITCKFENDNQASLRHAVVDTLVIKNNQILLVKRSPKLLLEGNKWALPGGFVDRDETTKQAAVREVMEETGYKVKNVKLLTINDNPNRPSEDRQNISFIFLCEATKQTGKSDWEVDEQKWFDFDSLPEKNEVAFDHYESIELYIKSLEK